MLVHLSLAPLLIAGLLFSACKAPPCLNDSDCLKTELCLGGHCLDRATEAFRVDVTPRRGSGLELSCDYPLPGHLVLNEILSNPGDQDANGDGFSDAFSDEFVEFVNIAETPVALGGLRLMIGSKSVHTFEPQCLDPDNSLVLFGGGPATNVVTGSQHLVSDKRLSLSNGGATVRLINMDGMEIDGYRYPESDAAGASFTRIPDGLGSWEPHPLLETRRISPGLCNNGGAFPACTAPTATVSDDYLLDPLHDCAPLEHGELHLNEILADPGLTDANGDGLLYAPHDEFVELVLVAKDHRRMKDVRLLVNGVERFQFPDKCLKPGSVIVLFGGGTPRPVDTQHAVILTSEQPLRLPNNGGQLSIHLGNTLDTDVVWSKEANKDQSITRHPDLTGDWVLHSTISPFSASPGFCSNGAEIHLDGCE